MSVINQVLNELEKRGGNAPLGEATIRAVPPRRPSRLAHYALLAVALSSLFVAAQWYLSGDQATLVESHVSQQAAGYPLVSGLSDSAPAPAAGFAVAAEQPAAMADVSAAASKLSFELSAIPLPDDGLRSRPESEADKKPGSVATPVRKAAAQRERQQVQTGGEVNSDALRTANAANIPLKQISPRQRAESEFHTANQAARQGSVDEAIAGYQRVLQFDPLHHDARRALVGVLLGAKRNADAERVLKEGLKRDTRETSFAMLLARLQVERDALPLALETLQKNLAYAGQRPDYHAFVAALLQRQARHQEAAAHFQVALQQVPNNGVWLMGAGISLQAVQRNADARDAYQRALASNSLNPQLQDFVQKKLKEL